MSFCFGLEFADYVFVNADDCINGLADLRSEPGEAPEFRVSNV